MLRRDILPTDTINLLGRDWVSPSSYRKPSTISMSNTTLSNQTQFPGVSMYLYFSKHSIKTASRCPPSTMSNWAKSTEAPYCSHHKSQYLSKCGQYPSTTYGRRNSRPPTTTVVRALGCIFKKTPALYDRFTESSQISPPLFIMPVPGGLLYQTGCI